MQRSTPLLSLAALTVLPCSPLEQIEAAYHAGFEAVGLRLLPVMPTDVEVMVDSSLQRAIEHRLASRGLRVLDIEVVRVGPDTNLGGIDSALRFGRDLGAVSLTFTSPSPAEYSPVDETRFVAKIQELCDMTGRFSIKASLEFMIFRAVSSLDDAFRIARLVNHPYFAICLDALHLFRAGGTAQAVSAISSELFSCVQLCDAPRCPPAPSDIPAEARYDRLYPGEGELPLRELLEALPADVPLSLEAPCRARARLTPTEKAEQIRRACNSVLQTVQHPKPPRGIP